MSWPSAVVPSQCALDGGSAGSNASRFGSSTEVNRPGTTAKMVKTPRMHNPAMALRLRSAPRSKPPRRRVGDGGAPAAVVSTRRAVTGSSPGSLARVEPGDREVAQQQRDQHGEAEEHEQRL